MAAYAGPEIVEDGLVLYLDAANERSYPGSGTTWYDLSGNANHGILTNSPSFSTDGISFSFDGANDNVQLGSSSKLIKDSQNSVTINAWVKPDIVGVYKKIFVNNPTGSQYVTGLYLSTGPSSGRLYFGVRTTDSVGAAVYGQYLPTGSYSNVCGTYDGSLIRLYLNGVFVASKAMTGFIGNSGISRISGYDNGGEIWDGNISIISVYSSAISDNEVLQNFNATRSRFGI